MILDQPAPGSLLITGAVNNGAGLIRLTVSSTATLTTGDVKAISSVGGVPLANGNWVITVITATTFDLQGSLFSSGSYTSGGIVGGSLDALTFSLDSISTSTLPKLSIARSDHTVGFFSGPTLEATLETPEQEISRTRINVNGLRPVTDATGCYAALDTRDTLNSSTTSGTESLINSDGDCPVLAEGRFCRARLRIPAGTAWTYATGLDPDFIIGGRW